MEDLKQYKKDLDNLLQFQLGVFSAFKKRSGAKGKIALGINGTGSYVIKSQTEHVKYIDRFFMQPYHKP